MSRVLSKCCQIHKGQKANNRRDLCQGIHSKKHLSKYYSLKYVNKNSTPKQTMLILLTIKSLNTVYKVQTTTQAAIKIGFVTRS